MRNKRNLITLLMMMTGLFAQSISGVVGGEKPLQGANVVVVEQNLVQFQTAKAVILSKMYLLEHTMLLLLLLDTLHRLYL